MRDDTASHPSRVGPVQPDLRSAPVALYRVCGISASALDELAAPRTLGWIRKANESADVAATFADELSPRLYAAVRDAGHDPERRRALLTIRRGVHRGVWTARHRSAAEAVRAQLDPRTANKLALWVEARAKRDRHLEAAETSMAAELPAVGRAILARLRDPDNLRGLALASPDFTRALLGQFGATDGQAGSRFMRTATSYFARIATKTVPFSSFVTVGLTTIGDGEALPLPSQPDSAAERSVVTSARTLAVLLLLACARRADTARLLEVIGNRGLRRVDGRWIAALPVYVSLADGAGFRYDERTDCDSYGGLVAGLPDRVTPLPELTATSAYDMTEPAVRRLVETCLLQPRTPWVVDAARPLGAFADHVRTVVDTSVAAAPSTFALALETLAASETRVADGDAAGRVTAIGSARSAARDAFAALGQPVPRWLDSAPLFHEAVATDQQGLGMLPEPVQADLLSVAAQTIPRLGWSAVYDRMVRFFVARYGIGGSCADVLEFLYSFDSSGSLADTPGRSVTNAERGKAPPAAVTVFFQLAATGQEDLKSANYRLVVNAVYPDDLGFLTRWAHVPLLRAGLVAAIRQWTTALHPGCRVYQYSAYPDFAELQRPVGAALPVLRWPTDLPARGDRGIELSRLRLTHDPDSGLLRTYDSDGTAVALCYTGTVPRDLLTGPIRLLSILTNPWQPPADGLVEPIGSAGYSPRVTRQRIVWARARWTIPATDVPAYAPGTPLVAFLASVERWRRAAGLPDQVFVHLARGTRPVGKPRWVGFDHPHTIVAGLRNVSADATHIAVTEALPATNQHWARDRDGEPVATEFVALVSNG